MKKYFLFLVLLLLVLLIKPVKSQDFDNYWKQFKNAVKSEDVNTVCNLTYFPFNYGWLNPNEYININEFKEKEYIPSIEIVNIAKLNKEIKAKKDKDGFTKSIFLRFENDEYILSFEDWNDTENYGSWNDYYFKIINGVFKYYKFVRGD